MQQVVKNGCIRSLCMRLRIATWRELSWRSFHLRPSITVSAILLSNLPIHEKPTVTRSQAVQLLEISTKLKSFPNP